MVRRGCLVTTAGCVVTGTCPEAEPCIDLDEYVCDLGFPHPPLTVSLPSTISWGTCSPTPPSCSPSASSMLFYQSVSNCFFIPISTPCVGGWRLTDGALTTSWSLLDGGSCAVWFVLFRFIYNGHVALVCYEKRIASLVGDSPVGTYNLAAIFIDGVACSGASADETITVSI